MWKPLIAVVLVLWAAFPAHAEVIVTRLDGSTVAGDLSAWSANSVSITNSSGAQPIPFDQLLSVRFSAPPAASAQDAKPPMLELMDGSLLPISNFRVAGTKATATVVAGSAPANQKEVSIATRLVAAVRLKPLAANVAPQWDEIRQQKLPSDVLVVAKRGGESLDFVEGVLGDIAADKIDFKMDGETTRADRTRVAGMIYYRRETQTVTEPWCIISGRSGLKAVVSQAVLEGDLLRLKTVSGADLTWPLADVLVADFSAGKIVYLSDLTPAAERWTPLVALPSSAAVAAAYGRVRRDQSPFNRPLALSFFDEAASGGRRTERSFDKGLALRSRTELNYRLPAGYRRLTALAGIDPATSASGNVALSIQGDDRNLFEREIAGARAPAAIDIDITGVRRLTIVADYGRNLDSGDWLILGDARIVK